MRGTGTVFVSGATGYLGRALIPALLERGHTVRALTRPGSESRVPRGAEVMLGNALDAASVQPALDRETTLVHLTGTPKPAPWKGKEFRAVDQVSLHASLEAACRSGAAHLVYVSVAHPAPVMRAYIAVRRQCEEAIRASGIRATVLRPWYVLGERHWWPLGLKPCYRVAEWFPPTRKGALRLGLLWLDEMIRGLVWAVENPPGRPGATAAKFRVLAVPDIRALSGGGDSRALKELVSGGKDVRKVTHVSAGR